MELAFVIYLIGILGNISALFITITCVMFLFAFICGFYCMIEGVSLMKSFWVYLTLGFLALGINASIPSERTAYMMLGAYVAQSMYESPNNQEVISKVYKIVNKKLDQYILEDVKPAKAAPASKK